MVNIFDFNKYTNLLLYSEPFLINGTLLRTFPKDITVRMSEYLPFNGLSTQER